MYIFQLVVILLNLSVIIWNCVNLYKLHKINKEIEQEQKAFDEMCKIPPEYIIDENELKKIIDQINKSPLLIYDECGDPDKRS